MSTPHVILNPNAGSAEAGADSIVAFCAAQEWKLAVTQGPGDATSFARQAAEAGASMVVAAGGDGTLFETVQGMMSVDSRPPLAVLPMGTGNDVARALDMPLSLSEACEWLASPLATSRPCDVLRVESDAKRIWALNAVNGGIANELREALPRERKQRWGPLAYPIATLERFGELRPSTVTLSMDDRIEDTSPHTYCVIASNGPTVGGGQEVAPTATFTSGFIEVVVVLGEGLVDLARAALQAKLDSPFASDCVEHHICKTLTLQVPETFNFTVDGEVFEATTLTITVEPAVLPLVGGPGHWAPSPV